MSLEVPQLHPDSSVEDVQFNLAALENPKMRAVNERHGNDYGVNLSQLRALAKQLKVNHELGLQLWEQDTAAQLIAVLVFKPRAFEQTDIEGLILTAKAPKVREWVINYIAKKSKHLAAMRDGWINDDRTLLKTGGWELMAHSMSKGDASAQASEVLDKLTSEMGRAQRDVQWAMNNTLAQIGINHPDLRERAVKLGEQIGAFKDYPTPAGCVSPYAPVWIEEMVRRQSVSS